MSERTNFFAFREKEANAGGQQQNIDTDRKQDIKSPAVMSIARYWCCCFSLYWLFDQNCILADHGFNASTQILNTTIECSISWHGRLLSTQIHQPISITASEEAWCLAFIVWSRMLPLSKAGPGNGHRLRQADRRPSWPCDGKTIWETQFGQFPGFQARITNFIPMIDLRAPHKSRDCHSNGRLILEPFSCPYSDFHTCRHGIHISTIISFQ
jgi:hypothetical protein